MKFKLRTLTPIWTGGVENDNNTLHMTGLKGSIRWWYEALVRGLDGYACDPIYGCTLDLKEFKKYVEKGKREQEALDLLICPACQMFGCTNWGSKFILRIEDNSDSIVTDQVTRCKSFTLKFIKRKDFTEQEIKLLTTAIKIIVEYGAIGGRTTLKPSEVPYKNCERYWKHNHIDYGVLAYQEAITTQSLEKFAFRIKKNEADWPNLKFFWFVKGAYINRIEYSGLVNRNKNSKYYKNTASEFDVFTGGYIKEKCKRIIPNGLQKNIEARETRSDGESKKIFSFHGLTHCDGKDCVKQDFPPRCFGYTRNDEERKDITAKIKGILKGKKITPDIKEGLEVLNGL